MSRIDRPVPDGTTSHAATGDHDGAGRAGVDVDGLATEGRLPAARDLDQLSTVEQVALVVGENVRAVSAVADATDALARAVETVTERLRRGGRLVFVGAGTSGRLGVMDAVEVEPTFSAGGRVLGIIAGGPQALHEGSEVSEDAVEAGRADIEAHDIGPDDAVVAVAASGRTPYAMGALEAARERGAHTIAVANNPDSRLAAGADLAVEVLTGPEVVSGSTRMKAATAQKVVLNVLSTLSMVALGHTWGDLMVNVSTSNDKLVRRAERIVMQITGVDGADAAAALEAAGGKTKVAIVMVLADVDAATARQRLDAAGGHARAAVDLDDPV